MIVLFNAEVPVGAEAVMLDVELTLLVAAVVSVVVGGALVGAFVLLSIVGAASFVVSAFVVVAWPVVCSRASSAAMFPSSQRAL